MSILVSAILSRLLTPENYGVVALATVMLALFNLFADIGIGPAVIQNKTLTAEDMNSINTFNSYQGLVLGVAGVLGLLTGGLAAGFTLAVFMSNSGGAWDNAKKMIE